MDKIISHINYILNSKGKLDKNFGRFSRIYLMTTENIKGFLQHYDLKDKEVLTVAGSGDQMLNAYLMGARNVNCFDINPLAFYQVKLKKAAVCALSYEEFLEFFFPEVGKLFDKCLFDKISTELDQETIEFFNNLYQQYDSEQILNKIYYRFRPKLKHMQRLNSYLDKDNYQKLSSILKEKDVSFIEIDIAYLGEKLQKDSYDMILLSNISDNIERIWPNNSLKNFKELIYSFSKNLKNYGVIQVGYIYDYCFNKKINLFRINEKRNAVFTPDEFQTTFVESYRFHSESDAIVSFQKKIKSN